MSLKDGKLEDINISRTESSFNDSELSTKVKNIVDQIGKNLNEGISEDQKLYFEQEIESLENILHGEGGRIKLRNMQKRALEALISLMKQGIYEGYIKLPTGGGKTILFALIVAAFQQGTLIMVPTVELIGQTGEAFEEEVGYPQELIKYINAEAEDERVGVITERILDEIGDGPFVGVIITTSAAVKTLYKKSPELLERLRDKLGLYVTDEGHTALGKVHLDMQENGLNKGGITRAHVLFTATPKLSNKHLRDHYREIIDIKLQEGVEDGVLVIPTFAGAGNAYLNLNPEEVPETLTQEFLDKHSLRFVDENGQYIYKGLTAKYLEVKNNAPYGYAPSIAVCATIEQAEFMTHYLLEQGVRAIRVTSSNQEYDEGVRSHEAKQMLLSDEVDVVVTVKKVGLGWNVATLRNMIRYNPTLSEVNLIQPFGRITRALEEHHIQKLIKAIREAGTHSDKDEQILRQMLIKTRENSNLIEPNFWQVRQQWQDKGGEDSTSGTAKNTPKRTNFKNVMNTIQILYETDELSWEEANNYYPGVNLTQRLTKELIKKTFDELGGYDVLINYTKAQVKGFKIAGYGVVAIAKVYGFESRYELNKQNTTHFKEFINYIYGKPFAYEKQEKFVLDPQQIKQGFDSLGGYEALVNYTPEEIVNISLGGNGILSIATMYGFKSKYDLNVFRVVGFQEFLASIYEKEFVYLKKAITPKIIKEELDRLGGYEVLMTYNSDMIGGNVKKYIMPLDINGHKILSIAREYLFNSKYDYSFQSPQGFREFISFVYGKEYKNELTKEEIKQAFDLLGGYETLKKYTRDQVSGDNTKGIKGIKVGGKGIRAIVTEYGFKSKYDLKVKQSLGFQEFLSAVYGKEFIFLSKEKIKEELDKLGGYDELIKLKYTQLSQIEINGYKISSIASFYGFESKYNLQLNTVKGFQEFLSVVYEKEFEYTPLVRELLKPEGVKKYFDKNLGGYETLKNYTVLQILSITIKGNKITGIAKACGFKTQYNSDLRNVIGFQEFISFVYGKPFEYRKE